MARNRYQARSYKRVLGLWATQTTADGLTPPANDRLIEIADGSGEALGRNALEQTWAPTIEHLFRQVRLGVVSVIAVRMLPESLRTPSGVVDETAPRATASRAVDTTEEAPVIDRGERPTGTTSPGRVRSRADVLEEALIAWRAEQIAAGIPGAEAIRDTTLAGLVKANKTSEEEIRKVLPTSAKPLAGGIAAVLTGRPVTPDPAPSAPVQSPDPAPSTPAPSPQPSPRPEPAPPRPAAPAQAPSTPVATPVPAGAEQEWTHGDFAAFDWSLWDGPPEHVARMEVRDRADDGARLVWERHHPEAGAHVVYRLISSDAIEIPSKPEDGELLYAGTDLQFHDERFLTSAVRHYQVWVHIGHDEVTARATQPVLFSRGVTVSPVDDMTVTEDEGRVLGRWDSYPGTRRVNVFRVPLGGAAGRLDDPQFQICREGDNLSGFVDTAMERGKRYLYRALAEVEVSSEGATQLSRPIQRELLVSVNLEPVTDLVVDPAQDSLQFDAHWPAPEGGQDIWLFKFPQPPVAGLGKEDLDLAALAPQGFTNAARVNYPTDTRGDGRKQMSAVPWPRDWDRIYLTPVTVAGARARVGATVPVNRALPAVTAPRIIERYDTVAITFGWPRGAAEVRAYIELPGTAKEKVTEGAPALQVSAEQYRRDGMVTFLRTMPARGCQIFLVPAAYSAGRTLLGEMATVDYLGLMKMAYSFEQVKTENPDQLLVELHVHPQVAIDNPPPLVLMNAPSLPLSLQDGRNIEFRGPAGRFAHCQLPRLQPGPQATGWLVDLTHVTGMIRLFPSMKAPAGPRLALRDPAIWRLDRRARGRQ